MDTKSTPSQPDIGDTRLDDVFYEEPELPEFLRDHPVLGRWRPPRDLDSLSFHEHIHNRAKVHRS